MVRTSCKNLYNVLNHSRLINWRLDQIVLIRWWESGGGRGGLLIFGEGNAKNMHSLPILDFPAKGLGTRTTKSFTS